MHKVFNFNFFRYTPVGRTVLHREVLYIIVQQMQLELVFPCRALTIDCWPKHDPVGLSMITLTQIEIIFLKDSCCLISNLRDYLCPSKVFFIRHLSHLGFLKALAMRRLQWVGRSISRYF